MLRLRGKTELFASLIENEKRLLIQNTPFEFLRSGLVEQEHSQKQGYCKSCDKLKRKKLRKRSRLRFKFQALSTVSAELPNDPVDRKHWPVTAP
jgi:hypothetical protein